MYLGMQHSGIGGGGFMLVRDSDGNYESIGRTGDGNVRDSADETRLPRNSTGSGVSRYV
jgi:gamma-glutamyltranspeptidase